MTPIVVRPRRLTYVCWGVAVLAVGAFALIGWGLTRTQGELQFGLVDQALMTGVGVFLGAVALGFTRARVVAGGDGIRVRNAFREVQLPWGVVRAVRFEDGAPWASLDLQDDETVALFAVQASDGQRAVRAVQELQGLLEQSRRTA